MVLSISYVGVACRAASAATVSYMRVSLVAFRPMHVQMDRVLFCKLHCPKQQMFDAVAPVLRSIIGIVISELWTPLEGEIASLFG